MACTLCKHTAYKHNDLLHKWCKKLGFCYEQHIWANANVLTIWCRYWWLTPACNFIENKTPTKVFSCKFCNLFFQAVTLSKMRLQNRSFLVSFKEKIQPATLLKTRLQYKCFPVKVAKFLGTLVLQNICEGLFPRMWSLLDSFVRFIVH